jgi:hypothetical protein
MKQSDALHWQQPGSLPRPRVLGRLARLAMAVVCGWVLFELSRYWAWVLEQPTDAFESFSIAIAAMFWVFNYVINIGFGVSLGRKPVIGLLAGFVLAAIVDFMWTGDFGVVFGGYLIATLAYFYTHLGVSFLLAGLFATPGCEMRAIAHIIARSKPDSPDEHHCPAGFLHRLDEWESR